LRILFKIIARNSVAEGNQIVIDGNSADKGASAANPNINYNANNYSNLPSILQEIGERW
jgi:hypothetical protein